MFWSASAPTLVPAEVSLGWVYLPPVLVVVTLGIFAAWVVTTILNRLGWNRIFWHPQLVTLAIATLISALIGLFVLPP